MTPTNAAGSRFHDEGWPDLELDDPARRIIQFEIGPAFVVEAASCCVRRGHDSLLPIRSRDSPAHRELIYLRVMMYAMTFRKSSSAIIMFGMVRWDVRRIAARAMAVMPGVFARVSNVCGSPLGDRRLPAWAA